MIPRTELLQGIVPLDAWGCVQTDESMQTGVPGLFAAGDIRAKPFRQITTAVADGTIAALAAQKYLRENPNWPSRRRGDSSGHQVALVSDPGTISRALGKYSRPSGSV